MPLQSWVQSEKLIVSSGQQAAAFLRPHRTRLLDQGPTFARRSPPVKNHKTIPEEPNFLIIYAKNKDHWTPTRLFTARERDERYGWNVGVTSRPRFP